MEVLVPGSSLSLEKEVEKISLRLEKLLRTRERIVRETVGRERWVSWPGLTPLPPHTLTQIILQP